MVTHIARDCAFVKEGMSPHMTLSSVPATSEVVAGERALPTYFLFCPRVPSMVESPLRDFVSFSF